MRTQVSTRTSIYVDSFNRRVDFKANQLYCMPGQLSAYENWFFLRCFDKLETLASLVLRLNPEKAAAIDAVMEVLSVSHTVVSTKDRTGKLKYEALDLMAVVLFSSFEHSIESKVQGPTQMTHRKFFRQAESPDEGALVEAGMRKRHMT